MSPDQRAELLELAEANDAASLERSARFRTLTERERQVLDLLVQGRTPKEIARTQGTAVGTVRNQIKSIRAKLGVQTQLAAVALARDLRAGPS